MAITAFVLQETFRRIIADGGVQNVHKDILPVDEIFRIQKMEEAKAAEARFLRQTLNRCVPARF